jgi:LysM repeat protein
MSTTTTSRTATVRGGSASGQSSPSERHLRLVTSAGVGAASAAELRARAAHPAGKGLGGPRQAPGSRHAERQAPLRLTRRGRHVVRAGVVLLMLLLMTVAALGLARGASAADGPVPRVTVVTHVVLPGETLWGIAQQVAPDDDPRDTVARIVEFNAMTSPAVQAGQRLALPPGLPMAR